MPETNTICGYVIADVRKSLCDAIDHRDRRAALRWTAELVTTPGAVGSLWAAYWLAWSAFSDPTLPILLKQSWSTITDAAHAYAGDWTSFRNDPSVRATAAEITIRLLDQPRLSPVIWPSKEIILYDVGNMRTATVPVATDGPVVMTVWRREDDALEYRMMAGQFLTLLESGDLRGAMSAVAWTMTNMSPAMKCGARGPTTLPAKARTSPIWFWMDIGRVFFQKRTGLHRGWVTMQSAITEAFHNNYRRWTAGERMRILLAWILQLRASVLPPSGEMWTVAPIQQSAAAVDLAYKELATELTADIHLQVIATVKPTTKKAKKDDVDSRTEAKMAEADAAIMASLGIDAR